VSRRSTSVLWGCLLGSAFRVFPTQHGQGATHFYAFACSFVLSASLHGLNNFDKVIYGKRRGGLVGSDAFVHFCLAFPERGGGLAARQGRCL